MVAVLPRRARSSSCAAISSQNPDWNSISPLCYWFFFSAAYVTINNISVSQVTGHTLGLKLWFSFPQQLRQLKLLRDTSYPVLWFDSVIQTRPQNKEAWSKLIPIISRSKAGPLLWASMAQVQRRTTRLFSQNSPYLSQKKKKKTLPSSPRRRRHVRVRAAPRRDPVEGDRRGSLLPRLPRRAGRLRRPRRQRPRLLLRAGTVLRPRLLFLSLSLCSALAWSPPAFCGALGVGAGDGPEHAAGDEPGGGRGGGGPGERAARAGGERRRRAPRLAGEPAQGGRQARRRDGGRRRHVPRRPRQQRRLQDRRGE